MHFQKGQAPDLAKVSNLDSVEIVWAGINSSAQVKYIPCNAKKPLIHRSKHDMCEKYNSLLPEFFNDQQAIGFSQIVPCFFVVARTTVEKLRSYPPGQILVQEIILPCIRICNQLIIGYNNIQTHLIHCPKPTSDSKYFMSKSLHPVVSATH